jgi:hypothetical protein
VLAGKDYVVTTAVTTDREAGCRRRRYQALCGRLHLGPRTLTSELPPPIRRYLLRHVRLTSFDHAEAHALLRRPRPPTPRSPRPPRPPARAHVLGAFGIGLLLPRLDQSIPSFSYPYPAVVDAVRSVPSPCTARRERRALFASRSRPRRRRIRTRHFSRRTSGPRGRPQPALSPGSSCRWTSPQSRRRGMGATGSGTSSTGATSHHTTPCRTCFRYRSWRGYPAEVLDHRAPPPHRHGGALLDQLGCVHPHLTGTRGSNCGVQRRTAGRPTCPCGCTR